MQAPGNIALLKSYLDDAFFENDDKGRRLYRKKGKQIAVPKFTDDEIKVIVPSETTRETYKVTFTFDYAEDIADAECNCPAFSSFGECKHCIAAAVFLVEDYTAPQIQQEEPPPADGQPSWISLPFTTLSYGNIRRLSRKDFSWRSYRLMNGISLVKQEDAAHWFAYKETVKKSYEQEVRFVPPKTLEVKCSCGQSTPDNLCVHLIAALTNLEAKYGQFYFNRFKDFTKEKNALLAPYGITVADEEAKEFSFGFDYNGAPILTDVPPYIVEIKDETSLADFGKSILPRRQKEGVDRPALPAGEFIDFDLGYLLNFAVKQHIQFALQPLAISSRNGKTSIEKITLSKKGNLAYLKALPDDIYLLFAQLTDEEMKRHLLREGHTNLSSYSAWQQQMDTAATETLRKHYHTVLKALWPHLLEQTVYTLPRDKMFSVKNLNRASLGAPFPSFHFKVTQEPKFITLQLFVTANGETFPLPGADDTSYLFININNTYYLPETYEQMKLMQQFEHGVIKFPAAHRRDVLRKIVLPLQQHYAVETDERLRFESRREEPSCQVMVSEYQNKYLMLKPEYVYAGYTMEYSDEPDILSETATGFSLIERDKETEQMFFEKLGALHPSFAKQNENPFYYLPFADVMKDNWFLHIIRCLQDENITVKGMQDLKKFRYNTNTPKWDMKTSSGTDWFDLQITVGFGEQTVPLRDIQKAIRTGQKIVILGDGTFGVLPEEWLQQYAMMMKMAEEEGGSLRIHKMHFTVIDDLHSLINEDDVLRELEEKKQHLQQIETVAARPVSKHIKAKLRPYQQSGYHWMQVLDSLGWGGCLADDMGLGKTLQAICFLQYVKETYRGATSLVVCPTSLIYNWESELQKFAPSLRYHIYHGASREFTGEHLEQYDVIITSYGTMRMDIASLQPHCFHYVILDESQHIKNPDAQVTRAAQLLTTKNRLILSGTPVQNNTFDLYAQMHFLNPGFLGNKEFFKTEFATPIDKNSDAATAAQLRRLIYPFMLRRTKEQVATELPDKTETILWCEMDNEQRAVYDEYRNYYRHKLLNKIEEEGMSKAAIYILEGLLRLRQICDSPLLLKDKEVSTSASIKLTELLRETEENTGSHKLLLFSQFTEMLALVKEQFIQHNIPFLYLDGSTPAAKRKDLVEQFQTDSGIKAFLISLKAGGVGLNLTAADYVYLIDPWWNPALEDQAIDRTHRIGQTNKVFAYKMICKDTVEEKILQLQQKKKSLTKELISEEAGFIKKLSKDDVMFLFS